MKSSETFVVGRYLKLVDRAKALGIDLRCRNGEVFSLNLNGTVYDREHLDEVHQFIIGVEAGIKRAREM